MLKKNRGKALTGLAIACMSATPYTLTLGLEEQLPPGGNEHPYWQLGEIQRSYEVSSIADRGQGSLRDAIEKANASPGPDKIIFRSAKNLYSQVQTVSLDSPLPTITDDLLIDGYIDDMLWKSSGVVLDGKQAHGIIRLAPGTRLKIKHLSLINGREKNGGAIYSAGELVVDSCTLHDNLADTDGGAIFATGPQTYVINSTFYNNRAARNGGGLAAPEGMITVTHATFTGNSAQKGGAVHNGGSLKIRNSILANSEPGKDCHATGKITGNIKNIIETSDGCGSPYSTEDPKLGKPNYFNGPGKTISLGMRSPATNYGDNDSAVDEYGKKLKWDQRGNGDPRDAAGVVDIGAFETQAQNVIQVDTPEDVDYRWCVVFKNDCSLRGALRLAGLDKRFPTITFHPEIFTAPVILRLPESLPEISKPILIEGASDQSITLSGSKTAVEAIDKHPLITLENIKLTVD